MQVTAPFVVVIRDRYGRATIHANRLFTDLTTSPRSACFEAVDTWQQLHRNAHTKLVCFPSTGRYDIRCLKTGETLASIVPTALATDTPLYVDPEAEAA